MQIAEIAKSVNIPLVASDKIDTVFDGADQIDSHGYLIKGGGGALLRENILASSARKIVIMADHTKFSKYLNKNVPVEVHPFAKYAADTMIKKMGGKPTVRTLDRGYPFITENGNLVLDCDFGTIKTPASLARKISTIAGVIASWNILRRPDLLLQGKDLIRYQDVNLSVCTIKNRNLH